ncbi:MAG: hypothetical protein ACRDH9_07125 [Actinomycetota bacterium]
MDNGGWIVAVSASAALAAALVLRSRAPGPLVVGILAIAGAGLGWGGMLIQPDPSVGEFVAAVALLAGLVPAHVRIVLGPFGPQR